MKTDIAVGAVDHTVLVFIPDPTSTTGAGKTGLTHASFTVSYTRVETDNDVIVTDVTSSLTTLSALTDAHADWGLKEVSSTLAPGLYRMDIADAVFATGAWYAVVYVMITSGTAAASPMEFLLGAFQPRTSVGVATGGIANTAFASGAIDAAAIAANALGASELAQDAAQEIADEVLNRNVAGGGSGNTRNVRNALRSLRNKVAISAGTATIYEEDDTTSAWTAAITTAAGNPISVVDPA